MRTTLAVCAFLIVLVTAKIILQVGGDAIGIASEIDLGGPITIDYGLYEEETDTRSTDFGTFGLVVGGMFGWRAYRWVKFGRPQGDLSDKQAIMWRVWLSGAIIYTLLSVTITKAHWGPPFPFLLKIGVLAGTFKLMHDWYRKQLASNANTKMRSAEISNDL